MSNFNFVVTKACPNVASMFMINMLRYLADLKKNFIEFKFLDS